MKFLNNNANCGDVFFIPAINKCRTYGFVLGRYIESVKTNVGCLIEVFESFHKTPPQSVENGNITKRLFRPILCSLRFSEIPRWKILFSDKSYDRSNSGYENISIAFHREIWKGGQLKKALPAEMTGLEDATCWRMHHIIFRVNAHLAGYFGPNDSYDYHRVPESERIDSATALARVIDVAAYMDKLSREW